MVKRRKRKKIMKEEIEYGKGNTLLFVLVLLVIIVSVFSTLIVLNSVDNAKKFFLSQQRASESAEISLNILPNPENPVPATGNVIVGRLGVKVLPQEE